MLTRGKFKHVDLIKGDQEKAISVGSEDELYGENVYRCEYPGWYRPRCLQIQSRWEGSIFCCLHKELVAATVSLVWVLPPPPGSGQYWY